jgi:hypothetical protein
LPSNPSLNTLSALREAVVVLRFSLITAFVGFEFALRVGAAAHGVCGVAGVRRRRHVVDCRAPRHPDDRSAVDATAERLRTVAGARYATENRGEST